MSESIGYPVIDGWKREEYESLDRAYHTYTSNPGFKAVEEKANSMGFRIADGFDRRNLAPSDLYSFAGGVWVRVSEEKNGIPPEAAQ